MSEHTHPNPALHALRERWSVIADLQQSVSLLTWDARTYLGSAGHQRRARGIATLTRLRHEHLADGELLDLLADLEGTDLVGDDAALVRECRREVHRAQRLPGALVARAAQQFALAEHRWARARSDDDFASFAPVLRENFVIAREFAQALAPDTHAYDALHDQYERDSTAVDVERLFAPVRTELRDLSSEIAARGPRDDSVLRQRFDRALQARFATEVIEAFGFDPARGRLDATTHPFATGITRDDVRITTRYADDDLRVALFSTMHEAGHGIYEQYLPEAYAGTPLGGTVSLGVHESQSRLFENLIGRSLPFWEWAFDRLRAVFPHQLAGVDGPTFHRAINIVTPSLIRVEADEVTYHLHVMLRFELEQALLDGSLDVDDLPGAWNERSLAYLDVAPPDDRRGCLQDVHWAAGLIGYFPTYTIGTLLSVQLWEALRRDLGDVDGAIRSGDFSGIRTWLTERVHEQGRRATPHELTLAATGAPLSAAPFLRYVREKYGALYDL
ncbi:carboxypeptidase M32 [soil metagenome]